MRQHVCFVIHPLSLQKLNTLMLGNNYRLSYFPPSLDVLVELEDLDLFQTAIEPPWNDWVEDLGHEKTQVSLKHITRFYRRFDRCKESCMALLLTKRKESRGILSILPYDIVKIIARFLYTTKKEGCWEEDYPFRDM